MQHYVVFENVENWSEIYVILLFNADGADGANGVPFIAMTFTCD